MLDSSNRDRVAERRAATRHEILQAAWELCRQHGLAALSLREVARRVGLRAPSLYFYFDSKNAVFDAMYAQGYREFIQARPELPDEPLAGVRVGLRYFVGFCTADPVRHQLLFQRTIPGFEPTEESFALALEAMDVVRTWIDRVGLGGPEALDLYLAINAGLAAQQNANEPGGDRWTRLVDPAAAMFVEHARRAADPPATGQPSPQPSTKDPSWP